MSKLNIKVSRETSKWVKTLPDSLVEYLGEVLNTAVSNQELYWEDVSCMSPESMVDLAQCFAGVDTFDELKDKAEHFCWCWGFYGYRLQSRF